MRPTKFEISICEPLLLHRAYVLVVRSVRHSRLANPDIPHIFFRDLNTRAHLLSNIAIAERYVRI
jgi:hypothetical protein